MTDSQLLAHAYHTIMSGFVRDGRAPHYTELAISLSISPREALQVQRDLTASGLLIWQVRPLLGYRSRVEGSVCRSTRQR